MSVRDEVFSELYPEPGSGGFYVTTRLDWLNADVEFVIALSIEQARMHVPTDPSAGKIRAEDAHIPEEQWRLVERIFELASNTFLSFGDQLFDYYRESTIQSELEVSLGREEIWSHVHSPCVLVSPLIGQYAHEQVRVSYECTWDPEHGVAFFFDKNLRFLRVDSDAS